MTYGRCEEAMEELTRTFQGVEKETLTRTAFGRKVSALKLGKGKRKLLCTAAHHANEWITAPVLLKFAEELARAAEEGGDIRGVPAETILETARIHLVPMVDPDGVDLVTGEIGRAHV